MSGSASSSPIDGFPRGNPLAISLQQIRSNQSSPVTASTTASSRPTDSPRSTYGSMSSASATGGASRDSPATTPRHNNITHPQSLRHASGPTGAGANNDSPPASAAAIIVDKRKAAGGQRVDGPGMLRTSSMDSTVSSMSSTTTFSQTSVPPDGGPSSAEIAAMIASHGSAENLIRQLLREKRNAAAQNNQLFKLLNKQKTMMQGMHSDLERALADKERYRNLATSQHLPVTPDAVALFRKPSPAISTSSLPSSSSQDRLPVQRFPDVRSKPSQEFPQPPSVTPGSSRTGQGVFDRSESAQQPASASSKASASPTLSDAGDTTRKSAAAQARANNLPSPLLIGKQRKDGTEQQLLTETPPRTPQSPEMQADSARTSFTARRSMTQRKDGFQSVSTPGSPTENVATSPSTRKAPPTPLKLQKAADAAHLPTILPQPQSQPQPQPEDDSDSDYEEIEVDELPTFDRGRKKTREEDDLEREVLMIRAQRASESAKKTKSQSKGSKHSQKSPSSADGLPQSPSFKGISPPASPNSFQGAGPSASIASILGNPSHNDSHTSVQERILAAPLKSPGLPMSPRPQDRPVNAALPRQPNDSTTTSPLLSPQSNSSLPLSPRLPRQSAQAPPTGPLPQPPMSAPLHPNSGHGDHFAPGQAPHTAALHGPSRHPQERQQELSSDPQPGVVYQGLASDSYPDLLLPPNALPSILVKVTSSRLRPSRQSMYSPRGAVEESVFTLGIFARSNQKQLWRVEKAAVSLVSLEQQLRQAQQLDAKIPDKSLFTGHAPARIDARRAALEEFFESLLDTHMNERAALVLCRYFSTQVIPAEEHHRKESDSSIAEKPELDVVSKEGYLTKKGKNFGGWKARYFVLNDPTLKYYESPGGSLLGTIKLTHAQIGRQSSHKAPRSPSRNNNEDDADSQYRHAFLIMEPKRNNSSSQLQHVLCAESDVERDEWVEALMFWLGKEGDSKCDNQRAKATPSKSENARENKSIFQNMMKEKKDRQPDASEAQNEDALRGFSYGDAAPGQAPTMVAMPGRGNVPRNTHTPPPHGVGAQSSPSHGARIISGPKDAVAIGDPSTWGVRETPGISRPKNGTVITDPAAWGNKDLAISGPRNGAPIHDASQWGNRPQEKKVSGEYRPMERMKAPDSPKPTEKEMRKRSFWGGFGTRGHTSNESTSSISEITNHSKAPSRAVFGIPLAEAVEFCMAPGSPTPLPAVVHRCLEYLEARGAELEEGIFRISGSTLAINKMKERFNNEGDVHLLNDGTYYDVHAVASLLKLYLRELPESVLTSALYPEFAAVQELGSEQAKIKAFNTLVHRLPLPNWTLIHSLCRFLIQVDAASELSKMTIRNLCIVFAPTLKLSNPIITHFLRDFHEIFDAEPEGARLGGEGVGIEVTAPSPQYPQHLTLNHETSSGGGGLGLQYEDILQLAHGLNGDGSSGHAGVSMHTGPGSHDGGPHPNSAPRAHPRTGPGLSAAAGGPKDMKQKRRESSMLMMNFPAPGGGNVIMTGAAAPGHLGVDHQHHGHGHDHGHGHEHGHSRSSSRTHEHGQPHGDGLSSAPGNHGPGSHGLTLMKEEFE